MKVFFYSNICALHVVSFTDVYKILWFGQLLEISFCEVNRNLEIKMDIFLFAIVNKMNMRSLLCFMKIILKKIFENIVRTSLDICHLEYKMYTSGNFFNASIEVLKKIICGGPLFSSFTTPYVFIKQRAD